MVNRRKEISKSTYSGRVALNIRKARDASGLSAEQIVERMERFGFTVKTVTYRSWEGHRSRPDLDAIPALAKALKVKPHDILPGR